MPGPVTGWDCHVHVFGGGAVGGTAHYVPVPRPLQEIEALAAGQGVGHLVLVQPSVYGSDNSLVLDGLRASAGRHRGIVVLGAADHAEATLREWQALGVRGVRFNLVSPVGTTRDEAMRQMAALAPLLQTLGWHAQWYVRADDLPELASLQEATGVTFVLDHLAGVGAAAARDARIWTALERLARGGAWVKLSGWYRLQSREPYEDLLPLVQRAADLFEDRLVWGSDWPHTAFAPDALPAYDSTWAPVVQALGEQRARPVREAGAVLYA
jgi:predicted TIM-barrel fold metal-dependent hydrolase